LEFDRLYSTGRDAGTEACGPLAVRNRMHTALPLLLLFFSRTEEDVARLLRLMQDARQHPPSNTFYLQALFTRLLGALEAEISARYEPKFLFVLVPLRQA
jgi:hypothetical protein